MHGDGTESKGFHIRDGAGDRLGAAGRPAGRACCRRAPRRRPAQRAAQLGIRIVVAGGGRASRPSTRGSSPRRRSRRTSRSPTWATICSTCRCCSAPASAARRPTRRAEVRAAAHWVSALRAAVAAPSASSSSWCSRAGPLGRPSCRSTAILMEPETTIARSLVALLLGLAVGKAWERYKLQDGRWIDRRRARESPHYMLGLNFLVANQIDQAIEELTQGRAGRRRPARDPPDPRQPVSREGPGRPRHPGAPGAAPAAEPPQARTRQRAALPRPRLPARRLRRPRARGVHGGAAARSRQRVRADRTSRSCTKSSTSGTRRYATRQKLAAAAAESDKPDAHQRILAFLENELGLAGAGAADEPAAARRGSKPRSSSTPRNAPAYLHLGDVALPRRRRRRRDRGLGAARRPARPTAPTWRSRGSRRPTRRSATPTRFPALCRRLIAEQPAGLARPRSRSPGTSPARARRSDALELLFDALEHQSARPGPAPGDLADALDAGPAAGARRSATSS